MRKVDLEATAVQALKEITSKGKHSSRKIKRAQVLLQLHAGKTLADTAEACGVSVMTVTNIKNRYFSCNRDAVAALEEKPRPGQPPKVTASVEAKITSLACSPAPEGHAQWTLRMLRDRSVELDVPPISHETVRKILKKANSSPGRGVTGASPK